MNKYILVRDRVGEQRGIDPGHERYSIGIECNERGAFPLMYFVDGGHIATAEAWSVEELKEKLTAMLKAL